MAEKVKTICDNCGKLIYQYKTRVEKNKHHFCNKACYSKWQSKNIIGEKNPHWEEKVKQICKNNNLPFKYTGDGSFWIKNINPDFVECNGKKIAVEIFGDYWHSPLLRSNIPYERTYEGRKKALKKYGWRLIILWGIDLIRKDAEQFVLNELRKNEIVFERIYER